MGVMDIAKKVAAANAKGGGNFFNPGKGQLIVKALKDGTKPEFYAGETFVAELYVEQNEGFHGVKDAKGIEKPAGNPVGSTVSFICQFEEFPDTAYSNCKGFIFALMDETEESVAKSAAERAKVLATDPAKRDEIARTFKMPNYEAVLQRLGIGAWDAQAEFALAYAQLTDRSANPARGMRIRYATRESKPTKSGNILTLPVWETVKQDAAQIAAGRAKLDGTAPA